MQRDVARYYDRNTRRFLLVGRGRGTYSIHRELWGPGVESPRQAADHINRLVADEIAALTTGPHRLILDFGCGVGGTLFHLAELFPDARLRGITISPRQVQIAERIARRLGYGDRCSFSLGDFQTAAMDLRPDVIVAVESFAHSHGSDAFLANARRHLREEGYLIVADDFLAAEAHSLDARQKLYVDQFRAGWRLGSLCTAESLVSAAARHGLELEKRVDLTSRTRPGSRARDRLLAALSPLFVRLGLSGVPFYGNMIGGNALQVGLAQGFLRYQLLVLRKMPTVSPFPRTPESILGQ